MKVLQDLKERGFLDNVTDQRLLLSEMADQKLVPYIGFDLTAPSLHVGSLIQLRVLKKFMDAGHHVIVLLGDTTTKVGDPTGKDKSRPMLDDITIRNNRVGIVQAITRVLGPSGAASLPDFMAGAPSNPRYSIVSNSEWLGNGSVGFMEFMAEFGPHFTINRINTLDVVKRRLDNNIPMTLLEYIYVLLQSVDFLRLFERHSCALQIGGSDQWGNITNGVDLIRRVLGETAFGVTTKLLTTSSGEKMGKTTGGAIWLDPELTSPFDFYQFWRNIPDDRVEAFSLLFTDIPKDQVRTKVKQDINAAKEALALTVTVDVHGEEAAQAALDETRRIFEDGQAAVEFSLEHGATAVDMIAHQRWAESRGAARRLIAGNAVSLNGTKIAEDEPLVVGDVVRVGKKHSAKVVA